MNRWRWLHVLQRELYDRGEERLAEVLGLVPSCTVANEHERLEALVPEGLALACRLELPWAELFLRHWRMQSRVLHRYNVRGNLDQAVELLDFLLVKIPVIARRRYVRCKTWLIIMGSSMAPDIGAIALMLCKRRTSGSRLSGIVLSALAVSMLMH